MREKDNITKTHSQPHVSHNHRDNEYQTPVEYIELARLVMSSIDLDPASSETANKIVQAETYYTAESNGLVRDWFGHVWLNPPYSVDLITKFTDKFIAELKNIKTALILVNNATETKWFNKLVSVVNAICFPKGRIKFLHPNGTNGSPLQGQAVLYYGSNKEHFISVFADKGWCIALR